MKTSTEINNIYHSFELNSVHFHRLFLFVKVFGLDNRKDHIIILCIYCIADVAKCQLLYFFPRGELFDWLNVAQCQNLSACPKEDHINDIVTFKSEKRQLVGRHSTWQETCSDSGFISLCFYSKMARAQRNSSNFLWFEPVGNRIREFGARGDHDYFNINEVVTARCKFIVCSVKKLQHNFI